MRAAVALNMTKGHSGTGYVRPSYAYVLSAVDSNHHNRGRPSLRVASNYNTPIVPIVIAVLM